MNIAGISTLTGAVTSAGIISTTNTTASTTTATGSIVAGGGLGVAGAVNTGGIIKTTDTTQSTSTTTGSIITPGGLGVAKNAYVGGNLVVTGTVTGSGVGGSAFTTPITTTDATASTTTATGSIVAGGGLGVAGAINAGGVVIGTNITSTNATDISTLQSQVAGLGSAPYMMQNRSSDSASSATPIIFSTNYYTRGTGITYNSGTGLFTNTTGSTKVAVCSYQLWCNANQGYGLQINGGAVPMAPGTVVNVANAGFVSVTATFPMTNNGTVALYNNNGQTVIAGSGALTGYFSLMLL